MCVVSVRSKRDLDLFAALGGKFVSRDGGGCVGAPGFVVVVVVITNAIFIAHFDVLFQRLRHLYSFSICAKKKKKKKKRKRGRPPISKRTNVELD